MAKKTVKKIVEESLPDMEVVESAPTRAPDSVRQATKPGPSIEDLRRKYLGLDVETDGDGATTSREALAAGDEDEEAPEDVEVKKVRSKRTPADPADDPGTRTVIVSKKKGIIGIQG